MMNRTENILHAAKQYIEEFQPKQLLPMDEYIIQTVEYALQRYQDDLNEKLMLLPEKLPFAYIRISKDGFFIVIPNTPKAIGYGPFDTISEAIDNAMEMKKKVN